MRRDVAPQIRRGRIAVLEYDRVAYAFVDIGHAAAEDGGEFLLRMVGQRSACDTVLVVRGPGPAATSGLADHATCIGRRPKSLRYCQLHTLALRSEQPLM